MLRLGKRDGPKDSVHPVQIAEPSPSDPTEFPGEEEVMRIKTCFVWSGLTCPGVLLHPCAACRSTLLGQSIHSQAGHPQASTSNPLPPKLLAHQRRRMDLSIPVLTIVSYSICMRMRVGVGWKCSLGLDAFAEQSGSACRTRVQENTWASQSPPDEACLYPHHFLLAREFGRVR